MHLGFGAPYFPVTFGLYTGFKVTQIDTEQTTETKQDNSQLSEHKRDKTRHRLGFGII